MSGIYFIIGPKGKVYVGSSNDPRRRWREHFRELETSTHHCAHLQHAWSKYGRQSFTALVVERCAVSVLIEREQFWFDKIKSIGFLYNTAPIAGTCRGIKRSEETKAKHRKRTPAQQAHTAKMSETAHLRIGRKMPPRTKEHSNKLTESRRRNGTLGMSSAAVEKCLETRRLNGTLATGREMHTEEVMRQKYANEQQKIRPSYEELQESLSELGNKRAVGRKYNVSGVCIELWLRKYEAGYWESYEKAQAYLK